MPDELTTKMNSRRLDDVLGPRVPSPRGRLRDRERPHSRVHPGRPRSRDRTGGSRDTKGEIDVAFAWKVLSSSELVESFKTIPCSVYLLCSNSNGAFVNTFCTSAPGTPDP